MKSIGILLLFLLINFSALGLGAWLMGGETQGMWYVSLNKAPWTPPGWVFGAAWFSIMLLFSWYMYTMWTTVQETERTSLVLLFAVQWVLNVIWNPVFFKWHWVLSGLVIIALLWVVVTYLMIKGFKTTSLAGWLVIPYVVWLAIATSLNTYILMKN
jgi:translocator protein